MGNDNENAGFSIGDQQGVEASQDQPAVEPSAETETQLPANYDSAVNAALGAEEEKIETEVVPIKVGTLGVRLPDGRMGIELYHAACRGCPVLNPGLKVAEVVIRKTKKRPEGLSFAPEDLPCHPNAGNEGCPANVFQLRNTGRYKQEAQKFIEEARLVSDALDRIDIVIRFKAHAENWPADIRDDVMREILGS